MIDFNNITDFVFEQLPFGNGGSTLPPEEAEADVERLAVDRKGEISLGKFSLFDAVNHLPAETLVPLTKEVKTAPVPEPTPSPQSPEVMDYAAKLANEPDEASSRAARAAEAREALDQIDNQGAKDSAEYQNA